MATVAKSSRSTTITLASATAGPFDLDFRLFDTDTLDVFVNYLPRTDWTLSATFSDGFTDSASITFDDALSSGDVIVVNGEMYPNRSQDFNSSADLIGKFNVEFARLWAAVSEQYRNNHRSVRFFNSVSPVGLEPNKVLIANQDGDGISMGPTADEVSSAQGYAEDAKTARDEFFDAFASSQTVTVGSGGDFASINAAVAHFSSNIPSAQNTRVDLQLLSGFVMQEQLIVRGRDFSWLRITSIDPEVTIDRSAMTTAVNPRAPGGSADRYPAFAGLDSAKLPQIACLFSMSAAGASSLRDGILLSRDSSCIVAEGAGIKNSGEVGANVWNGSTLVANGAIFDGSGDRNLWVRWSSRVMFRGGSAVNAGWTNFQCENSIGDCVDAVLTGAAHYGIRSRQCSKVNANGADVSNSAGHGLNANEASEIDFKGGTATSCGITDNEPAVLATEGSTIDVGGATISGDGTSGVIEARASFIAADSATASSVSSGLVWRVSRGGTISANAATAGKVVTGTVNVPSGEGVVYDPSVRNLDLYETFSPVLRGATTAGSLSYSDQVGKSYRIGRLVHVEFQIVVSGITTAPVGELRIAGIPQTVLAAFEGAGGALSRVVDLDIPTTTAHLSLEARLVGTGTSGGFRIRVLNNDGSQSVIEGGDVNATTEICGSFTYLTGA